MKLNEVTYDYPFFFIFLNLLCIYLVIEKSYFALIFVPIFIISFLNKKLFLLSIFFIFIAFVYYYVNSYNREPLSTSQFIGTIKKISVSKALNLEVKTKNGLIYVFTSKVYDNLKLYDKIQFKAKLRSIKHIKNVGFINYLKSKNILYYGYAYGIKILKVHSFMYFIGNIKSSVEKEFYYFLPKREYIFIATAIFGDAKEKSHIKDAFINTQTAHIMSVSGLHMGFVFGIFYLIFYYTISRIVFFYRRFNLKVLSSVLSLVPTSIYFLLSGTNLPAMRAFIFMLIFVISLIMYVSKNSYNVLFFVASLFIMLSGFSVFYSASFVMSFTMSFFAIFLYSIIKDIKTYSIDRYILFTVLMSVLSMPLSMHYFSTLSYTSVFANAIVVPYFGFFIVPLVFLTILSSITGIYAIKLVFFSILKFALSVLFYIVDFFGNVHTWNIFLPLYVVFALYAFCIYGLYYLKKTVIVSK